MNRNGSLMKAEELSDRLRNRTFGFWDGTAKVNIRPFEMMVRRNWTTKAM